MIPIFKKKIKKIKIKFKIKIIVVKKIVALVAFSDIKKEYISVFSLDSEDSKILHNVI